MWTLHLILHILRYILFKIILHLSWIIDTFLILYLVILRHFGVFFTYRFLGWWINSVILHALSEIFIRQIIVWLNSSSLRGFFLLSELKLTFIRFVTFIYGHSTVLWKLWLVFLLIIHYRSSVYVDIICLRRGFLFEVALTMNFLDYFLVVIFNLFDFFLQVLKLFM